MRAEREKRAVILTSEGERDAKINEAEGEKQQVIKESEASKQQQINEAEGQAAGDPRGRDGHRRGPAPGRRGASQPRAASDAMQLRIAEQYVEQFGQLAKAGNTFVVPANLARHRLDDRARDRDRQARGARIADPQPEGAAKMPSRQLEELCKTLASQPPIDGADIEATRAGLEAMVGGFPLLPDTKVEEVEVGANLADWISVPESDGGRVVLYLHGGGYVIGSRRTHRELAARIAAASCARVLVLEYRLAPEAPFPAAVDDATAAFGWLRSEGIDAGSIAIAGDSAGGGLTLATLLALRDAGDSLPGCAICLSPWTDLEGTGASARPGAVDDPMVDVAGLRAMGRLYAADAIRNPLAAPLHGDFAGLPPLLIQVGTREILLDDATRVAERARGQGVEVTLEIEDGAPHVWQVFPGIPESTAAVERIGAFVRERVGRS